MRTQLNASPILTQGIEASQTSMMDMDLEGMKQACQIFRDNIYTDKILAVVREWTCNAVDEHLKHQVKQPVEIGLRDNKFFVRDFAKGLSDDGIRNVFGKYFRSTKSNSDQPIGGFGVGAKSGHCYNDVFYVTSHFEGTKTIYSCILGGDDTGASIGQVVELSQEPTKESGLLVEIEVDKFDAQQFQLYSREMALYSNLADISVLNAEGDKWQAPDKKLLSEKDGVKIYAIPNYPSDYVITMGGVKYKTPTSWQGFSGLDLITPKHTIQIDVPIGYFDVPISRESFRDSLKFKMGSQKCEELLSELIKTEGSVFDKKPLSFYAENKKNYSENFIFKSSYFIDPVVAMSLINFSCVGDENSPLLKHKGKVAVCIFSNHRSHFFNQIDSIRDLCLQKGVKVLVASSKVCEKIKDDLDRANIEGDFVFGKRQKFFPQSSQAKISSGKFSVYFKGRGHRKMMSPIELHNEIWKTQFTTEKEIQDFIKQKKEIVSNSNQLPELTVQRSKGIGMYGVTAKAMLESMIKLGYFDSDTPEFKTILADLKNKESELSKIRSDLQKSYNEVKRFVSKKTVKSIEFALYGNIQGSRQLKIIKRTNQIQDALNKKLKQENGCELARIFLKTTKESYYFQPKRSHLRLALSKIKQ